MNDTNLLIAQSLKIFTVLATTNDTPTIKHLHSMICMLITKENVQIVERNCSINLFHLNGKQTRC